MTMSSAGAGETGFEPEAFRDVMAGVASPVTVVTGVSEGVPHGTTVSAFTSLSLSPPMVLVSLDRGSRLLEVVRGSGRFGVNVLSSHQAGLALRFARKGGAEKFDGTEWSLVHGLPRLPEATGWLACETETLVDGGDHVVLLGRVLSAEHRVAPPLTYHARAFGTHSMLAASA
ncbi:flavin reductase family protein [Streptomyces sp. NPDC058464]|uniref:flavin reductase family protein n=1 Tax=Streptomyces sp. NPDC058464 TaxID=3346511 RepID=UPI00365B509D